MPPVNEDDFDAAFSAAITAIDTGAAPSADDPSVTQADADANAALSAEPVTEPVTAPAAEPVTAPAAEPVTEPVTAPAAEPVTEPVAAPAPALEDIEASILDQIPDPVMDPDVQAKLDSFRKDWPDIAEAVDAHTAHVQAQMEARVARLVASVVQSVYADIAPMAKTYASTEANSFRAAVLDKHSDYDSVFPQLEPWIKAQPAYLQSGMLQAYNAGSAEDIIDLVSRYKSAAGVMPQVPEPTAVQTSGGSPSVSAAAKAMELAPVQGKRTAPKPAGEDPNDFDSAFAQAAEQYNA